MRNYFQLRPSGGNSNQPYVWAEVSTDASGNNDLVWVTALAQAILLNIGESPFYSNVGVPGIQAVNQQVPPDFYVANLQQLYAPYFISLTITKQTVTQTTTATPNPLYAVNVITHAGVNIAALVTEIGYLVTVEGSPIVTSGGSEILL